MPNLECYQITLIGMVGTLILGWIWDWAQQANREKRWLKDMLRAQFPGSR